MTEKNQKKQEILNSARILFKERGFHNTRMDDIAIAAGVGKGTLYEYFKNKQEIFDESCFGYVESIIDNVEDICSMDISFKEKLLNLFNMKLKIESEFANLTIDNVLSNNNIISEKAVKNIIEKITQMYELIYSIIDQGKEEGVVIKEIQSEIIACMVVGTMAEYMRLKFHKKEYEIKEDDVVFDLMYNGFAIK